MSERTQALEYLQSNPVKWGEKTFGYTYRWKGTEERYTPDQKEAMMSVAKNKYTVCVSGNGVGKTFMAADIALWFLNCFENSIVITTAPTLRQVQKLLWKEVGSRYDSGRIGGNMNTLNLALGTEWFMSGFTASTSVDDTETAAKFQGFHSEHILFVFDEAPAVHPAFWEAIKGSMMGSHARFLAIGNPTSPAGPFYEAYRSNLYEHITIDPFKHPNVVSGQELIRGAVTKHWLDERKLEWGEDSPLYVSRCLAKFPDEGENTLIPLSKVEAAILREINTDDKHIPTCAIGGDIARFGTDLTCVTGMKGMQMVLCETRSKQDTMVTAGLIGRIYSKQDPFDDSYYPEAHRQNINYSIIGVDEGGLGGGVCDRLREQKYPVLDVNFGSSPSEKYKDSYVNKKAELYWNMALAFKRDEIAILNKGKMLKQLTNLTYEYRSDKKIYIPSKEEYKKEFGESPDCADSLAIALYTLNHRPGRLQVHKKVEGSIIRGVKMVNMLTKRA